MSIDKARESNLLTQKELMTELGVTSVRSVQRARMEYDLKPVDFYGVNPLFRREDVERMKEARRVRGMRRLKRQSKAAQVMNMQQLRTVKRRAAK